MAKLQGEIVVLHASACEYGGFGTFPEGQDATSGMHHSPVSGNIKLVRRGNWLVLAHNLEFGAAEQWWKDTVEAPDRLEFTGRVDAHALRDMKESAANYKRANKTRKQPW